MEKAMPDDTNVVPIKPQSESYPAPVILVQQPSGGGGGDDSWRQSVESRLNNLHSDISNLRTELVSRADRLNDKLDSHLKWLLGLLATSVIGLAGLIATGFGWIGGDADRPDLGTSNDQVSVVGQAEPSVIPDAKKP